MVPRYRRNRAYVGASDAEAMATESSVGRNEHDLRVTGSLGREQPYSRRRLQIGVGPARPLLSTRMLTSPQAH
jgi:hypothetical protein